MIEINKEEIVLIKMQVLKSVKAFCLQNSIGYFLAYSTLLGAVRNKGFIPWNNNLGVMLKRKDYEEFKRRFTEWATVNAPNLKIVSCETADFGKPYIKVVDTQTVMVAQDESDENLGVAVLPIDGMGNDRKKAERKIQKIATLSNMLEYKTYKTVTSQKVGILFKIKCKFVKKSDIIEKIDSLLKKDGYYESSLVAVPFGANATRAIVNKEVFAHFLTAEFEGEEFSIPAMFDEYLKALYGDYMSLPKENERKEKTIRVFKKNKEN